MTADFRKLIERGVRAHQRGRLQDALASYRKALKKSPDDAEALSLYGLALLHAGRPDEAARPLRRAVAAEPDQPGFRYNLMEYWEKAGNLEHAAAEAGAVLERDPRQARAWEKRGDYAAAGNRPGDAAAAYQQALAIEPGRAGCMVKLGQAALAAGDLAAAQNALQSARATLPDHAGTARLELDVLAARRDWQGLADRAREFARVRPDDTPGWYALSRANFERGRYRLAADAYREVLKRVPEDAATQTAYARICLHAGRFEAAIAALDRAETLAPDLPEMLAAKGLLLTYQGRFGDAERYTRRCLEAAPGYAPAYTQLVSLTRGRLSDGELATLVNQVEATGLPLEHRITAAFALANGRAGQHDVEAAFSGWQRAHALALERDASERAGYDRAAMETRVETLMRLFHRPAEAVPAPGPRPIFVVGMPRSGTTLVESVLSAHSRVAGGGERTMMQLLLDTCLADGRLPDDGTAGQWVAAYHEELPDLGGADHITDKHPLNFQAIGLIQRLFPEAPVIHIRRDPIETAFSIYRHEFSKFWTFAHRLEDIGHFYGQYARLMDHWQRVLGDRLVTLQYEDVAGNFDAAAPALLDACGLDWEPACGTFQEAERPITTLSAVQAREPVTLRIGQSTPYRHHLQPLLDALDAAGVDRRSGALLKR